MAALIFSVMRKKRNRESSPPAIMRLRRVARGA
jgi:hypothetical protein